jgi:hypothetical protein
MFAFVGNHILSHAPVSIFVEHLLYNSFLHLVLIKICQLIDQTNQLLHNYFHNAFVYLPKSDITAYTFLFLKL